MKIVGIICEYNPLHNGHARQIRQIRNLYGEDCAIVCLMSGNFVQRGQPALYHKMVRTEAALMTGADLVLELPVQYALNSAEGFAAGGVGILGSFCDELCFGSESGNAVRLMSTAGALLSPSFSPALRSFLDQGLSFPAARQKALEQLGTDASLLSAPNDILGVEYCKAILSSGTAMKPLVITRQGGYHDTLPDRENPSATALRLCVERGEDIAPYVPGGTASLYAGAEIHALKYGERAMLAKLRTMSDAEFEALPFGSEGLWRKLMHESRRCATVEQIASAVKSKRYTRTRIDRMLLCAFLGLTREDLSSPVPYTRVLGFTDRGRLALRRAKASGVFYNVGEKTDDPFQSIENRCADLYGLFAASAPECAGAESRLRVMYRNTDGCVPI